MTRPDEDQLWAWMNVGNARALYKEAQRARAEESRMSLVSVETNERVEELEAKLREAVRRAEKAEYERDEARGRLAGASTALHTNAHSGRWEDCPKTDCVHDRAAIGEKP